MRAFKSAKWAGMSVLFVSGAAYASFVPVFVNTSPSGANTSFNYSLNFGTVSAIERLDSGDFVTIYDIPGFVSATAPALFSVSTQLIGINGFGTLPADDPALLNITFTYTGPTLSVDTTFTGAAIVSTFNLTGLDNFTSETTSNAGGTAGQPIGQIGFVTVPSVGGGIPEPGVLSLGAFGALTLRRKNRK